MAQTWSWNPTLDLNICQAEKPWSRRDRGAHGTSLASGIEHVTVKLRMRSDLEFVRMSA